MILLCLNMTICLQLWQSLLHLRCPTSVEQDWHEVIKMIFSERVKLLTPDTRVDRFLELEGHADTPALITDILMTEATTALDEIMFRRVSMYMFIVLCCPFLHSQQHHVTITRGDMVTHHIMTLTSSHIIIDQIVLSIYLGKC